MKTKILILLTSSFIVIYIIFSIISDFDNNVVFTGDEWDYQSIGVNSFYDHEFLTTGRLEETEVYRFTELDDGKIRFWEGFSGSKAYHRVPFYPAFVSLTYKLFGIKPVVIKYIELFILILSGLLLVLIGKMAWGEKGFYIGYLSFITFVAFNYRYPAHLMPENWQFLFLSLITVSLLFHYRGSKVYSGILGLTLGLSCLNKGTTFFLFPLIIVADLSCRRIRNNGHWKNLVIFISGFVFITGLWSVYTSIERNQLTFLSTQTGDVLLDGNNEYCKDGLWHPEWRDRPDSWYNNDNPENKSGAIRVVNFYISNPEFVSNLMAKFKSGFAPVQSFIAMISFYLVFLAFSICRKLSLDGTSCKLPAKKIIFLFLICLAICFAFLPGLFNNFLFFSAIALIFSLSVLWGKCLTKNLELPSEFFIIILNFFIFTLVFYVCNETYPSRYVRTMDGILILLSFYLLFEIFGMFRKAH